MYLLLLLLQSFFIHKNSTENIENYENKQNQFYVCFILNSITFLFWIFFFLVFLADLVCFCIHTHTYTHSSSGRLWEDLKILSAPNDLKLVPLSVQLERLRQFFQRYNALSYPIYRVGSFPLVLFCYCVGVWVYVCVCSHKFKRGDSNGKWMCE